MAVEIVAVVVMVVFVMGDEATIVLHGCCAQGKVWRKCTIYLVARSKPADNGGVRRLINVNSSDQRIRGSGRRCRVAGAGGGQEECVRRRGAAASMGMPCWWN